MEKINIGLVGCGGMGTRHLYGLRTLSQTPFANVTLKALCDLDRENAELTATEAKDLMGIEPAIYTDLETMAREVPGLDAVDVVTDPSVHHEVVCQALDLGLHVMVEKPMAITVRACHLMIDAAKRNNRILSVAENYRRDPSARLVNHLLRAGAIGEVYNAVFHSVRGGNQLFITPWRHLKNRGGPLVDLGVHFTDMIRYQLGDIAEVHGDVRLIEKVRKKPKAESMPYEFYRKRHLGFDEEFPADAEDMSTALFKMESGALVNWTVGVGGLRSWSQQSILGTDGSFNGFGTRGGRVELHRTGGRVLTQEQLLVEAGLELDSLADHLFPTRVTAGDEEVDWKILAWEYHELGNAILNNKPVEVDGVEGMKDVAAIYAIFESFRAERPVTMKEVEGCEVYEYQGEIDSALGIE